MSVSRDPRDQGPSRAGVVRPRRRRRFLALSAVVGAAALVAAACTSGNVALSKGSSTGGTPLAGGTASYSLTVNDQYTWMLPLENEANTESYDGNVEGDMWPWLYFVGNGANTGINYALSVANPPVYSDNDTAVTITLKHDYTWSDGQPVTSSDVQFFFELEKAADTEGKNGQYVPGELPDNITSVTNESPYEFTLHLNHSYSPAWFTGNQLPWITPMPRQAWDKTCATCAIGNNAATPAGAEAVFNYLYAQSSDLATYGTNPIWKVVDGPWVIKSYDPTTYHAVLDANPKYTGPGKPHLKSYEIYTFSSDTAEVDAIRSGTVDYGFLPYSDLGEASYFENHGYQVVPWNNFFSQEVEFGYTSKTWGPLVRQLYIRQALQHLVDETAYLDGPMHGYGLLDYGVAPDYPNSNLVSPELRTDPDPYSISAAKALLAAHGWVAGAGGTDVCHRPGTGSNECGAGIPSGDKLSLLMVYATGDQSFLTQVEAFQTAAKSAGVTITLDGQLPDTMFTLAGVCPTAPPCNWGLAGYFGYFWPYGQYRTIPNGDQEFISTANFWSGGYDSPAADALINATHTTPGLAALYADQDYLSRQVANLWWPVTDYQILVVSDKLKGWELNPYGNYYPASWYWTK